MNINNIKEVSKPLPIKLIYFEGDKWSRKASGYWINISKVTKSKADQDIYIKGMINEYLKNKNAYKVAQGFDLSKEDNVTYPKINAYFNKLMMDTIFGNNISLEDIDRDKIELMDCVVDLKLGTTTYREDRKTTFTPYQIRHEIKDTYNAFMLNASNMTQKQQDKKDLVDKFFREISGNDKVMETSLLEVIGSTMAPINDSIFPIFYSPHRSSGKGTLFEIISNINGLSREISSDKWWGKNKSNFALSNVRNQLMAFIDEVPQRLPEASTEMIKRYADSKEHVEIERKSIDQEQTLNTMTFMAATNKKVKFYSIDDSLKGRVIWYEFKMNGNKANENAFSKQEIKLISKDKECLAYIIIKAITAYAEVAKKSHGKKDRNANFTKPESNNKFWDEAEEDNIALDIILGDKILANLWDAKDTFIANSSIRDAINSYKLNFGNDIPKLYNMQTFKTEIIDYIHSKNLGTALSSKHKGDRGIKIEWFNKGDK